MENFKDDSYSTVIGLYRAGNDMKTIRYKTGICEQKVRRILITEGLYENETSIKVKKLLGEGKKPTEIAGMLNMSYAAVNGYMPYEKGMYKSSTPTENAARIQKSRERRQGVRREAAPDYRSLVPQQPATKEDYTLKRTITYKVSGDKALFLDGGFRTAGEQYTYVVPTYQALKGATESIYWNPDIKWVVDKVRVMHKISTSQVSANKNGKVLQPVYLTDVQYIVQAHFEWSDTCQNRNYGRHMDMIKRYLSKGGRRAVFLGAEECPGKVEPCEFDSGAGYYDDAGEMMFDLMLHSLGSYKGGYATKAYFWQPHMMHGVIEVPTQDKCKIFRDI